MNTILVSISQSVTMKRSAEIQLDCCKKKILFSLKEEKVENTVNSLVQTDKKDIINHLVDPNDHWKAEETDLVELARGIETAYSNISLCSISKLKIIQQQMLELKKQARSILIEAKNNSVLHSLPCNFQKIVGHTYHVYKKSSNQMYFSMLSPEDWNGVPPNKYVASFRLESDSSWTQMRTSADNDILKSNNLSLEYDNLENNIL